MNQICSLKGLLSSSPIIQLNVIPFYRWRNRPGGEQGPWQSAPGSCEVRSPPPTSPTTLPSSHTENAHRQVSGPSPCAPPPTALFTQISAQMSPHQKGLPPMLTSYDITVTPPCPRTLCSHSAVFGFTALVTTRPMKDLFICLLSVSPPRM